MTPMRSSSAPVRVLCGCGPGVLGARAYGLADALREQSALRGLHHVEERCREIDDPVGARPRPLGDIAGREDSLDGEVVAPELLEDLVKEGALVAQRRLEGLEPLLDPRDLIVVEPELLRETFEALAGDDGLVDLVDDALERVREVRALIGVEGRVEILDGATESRGSRGGARPRRRRRADQRAPVDAASVHLARQRREQRVLRGVDLGLERLESWVLSASTSASWSGRRVTWPIASPIIWTKPWGVLAGAPASAPMPVDAGAGAARPLAGALARASTVHARTGRTTDFMVFLRRHAKHAACRAAP